MISEVLDENMTKISIQKRVVFSLISFFFILFTIASGHLIMVFLDHIDQSVSKVYKVRVGVNARIFSDLPIEELINNRINSSKSIEGQELLRRKLDEYQKTGGFPVSMLPVSKFLVIETILFFVFGLLLIEITIFQKSEISQTIIGVFSGLLLWTGVEYSLIIASRIFGIAKDIRVIDGKITGVYGEYQLLKHTWGILLLLFFFLLYSENSRCNFFVFFKKNLKLTRGPVISGKIDNYGPRVSFFFATITWFFYVVLLLAYDKDIFGVYSWFTYSVFFISFAFTGFLFLKLIKQPTKAKMIRYAIPTALVLWNDIEILAKWNIFKEPWLILSPENFVIFLGGLIIGSILIIKELRKER